MLHFTSAIVLAAASLATINAAPALPSPTGPMMVEVTPATNADLERRHHHHRYHEHRRPGYDSEHSQHWNYHHGYTDVDGPGNKKMRRAKLAALKKRLDDPEHSKLEARRHHRGHHRHHSGYARHHKRSHNDNKNNAAKSISSAAALPSGHALELDILVNKRGMEKRRHNRHHHHNDGHWYHGEWYPNYGYRSYNKRDREVTGVPGFVEVASQIAHSALAKSMAGLVFTAQPGPDGANFTIGTSDQHSTQFNLVAVNKNGTDPMYNLRIPILDSRTLSSVDYCATFSIKPPSPLSLEKCGDSEGYSQNFLYNSTTGQLSPVYERDGAPAKPNSFMDASSDDADSDDTEEQDSDDSASPDTTSSFVPIKNGLSVRPISEPQSNLDSKDVFDQEEEDEDSDDDSSDDLPSAGSFLAQPNVLKDDEEAQDSGADLYFIPSSSYYDDAQSIDDMNESDSPASASVSMSAMPSGHASMARSSAAPSMSASATASGLRMMASASAVLSGSAPSSALPTAVPVKFAVESPEEDADAEADDVEDDSTEDSDESSQDLEDPAVLAVDTNEKEQPCPMSMDEQNTGSF